jgi:hypothetical protein
MRGTGFGLIRTPLDDHWKLDGNAGRELVPAVGCGLADACAAPGAAVAAAEPASSAQIASMLWSVRPRKDGGRVIPKAPFWRVSLLWH